MDKDGNLPRLGKALLADSGATAVGALLGTSSTTSFIESAAGVESGGRTGLTAVVVGLLFLVCLLLAPLAQSIPGYAAAAALLFVSASMAQSLVGIDWPDVTESTPALLTAIIMPLSFSVANGIGIGFISYVSSLKKRGRSVRAAAGPNVLFIAAKRSLEGVLCLGNKVSWQFWQDDGATKQIREVGAEVTLVCQVLAGQ